MSTRRGISYLLEEFSESHSIPMKSRLDQITSIIASVQTQLKDIRQILNQSQERLTMLVTNREPSATEEVPMLNYMHYNLNNAPNLDE